MLRTASNDPTYAQSLLHPRRPDQANPAWGLYGEVCALWPSDDKAYGSLLRVMIFKGKKIGLQRVPVKI